jgi:hypothetical protein
VYQSLAAIFPHILLIPGEKHCVMGGCGLALGIYTVNDFLAGGRSVGLRVGFRNDGPEKLWQWSREAMWYETRGSMVPCTV